MERGGAERLTESPEEGSEPHAAESTASPGRSGLAGTGTQATGGSAGLAAWSAVHGCLAELDQQRRARLLPAASAVHLVPDIVVEHVSSSTFSHVGTSRHHTALPPFCQSLVQTSSTSAPETTATSRQAIVLAESPACGTERSSQSPDTRRRPVCASGKLQFSSRAITLDDPRMDVEISTETASELAWKRHRHVPPLVPVAWHLGSPYGQPSALSPEGLGPERSPKAGWLRRHSDSNLAAGHGFMPGLRVGPYPIRSHSTGDSTLSSAATTLLHPTSSAVSEPGFQVAREWFPSRGHSRVDPDAAASSQRWLSSDDRASLSVRKFFSEGSEPQRVRQTGPLQLSGRSYSDNVATRKLSSDAGEPPEVHGDRPTHSSLTAAGVAAPGETESTAGSMSCEQSEAVDMSTHDRTAGKSKGLVEKRLKLKKYLQTRYQMSQDKLHQSSDTDDVFTDRHSSPDLSSSSAASVIEVTQPKDLSTKLQSSPTAQWVSEAQARTEEMRSRGPSERFPSYERESRDSGVFRESSEPRSFPSSKEELPALKREPVSPGIVPRGTSVFVFPPPLPSHHHTDWYQLAHQQSSGSPLPSPMSSGISESYVPMFQSPPSTFRHPSCPGEDTIVSTHVASSRYHSTSSSASDLGPMYRFRGRSTAASTEFSPLPLSESLPPTPPRGFPTAVTSEPPLEAMSAGFPRARSLLSEQLPLRSRFAATTQHHRGRRSSSSFEDTVAYSCPVCSVAFASYRRLTDHLADHASSASTSTSSPTEPAGRGEGDAGSGDGGSAATQKTVHLCPVCQRSFSRGDMLTRHVRLHTGIRPYECSLCSQVFSRSDHLTTHQRTHTGEKPYRCPLCSYAAPRRDMVTRHARIHETSSTGSGQGGRRGRRAGSSSLQERGGGGRASGVGTAVCAGGGRARTWRHRSDSSGFASRQRWSPSTCEDARSSTSSSRRWSMTSGSVESADSAVVGMGPGGGVAAGAPRGSTAPSRPPVTCRAWSTTSAESFESYPGAVAHSSSLSSAPADSPDVFGMPPRYFGGWIIDTSAHDPATTTSSVDVPESSLSADVAGVMPALQKCSVGSPSVPEYDRTTEPD